MSSSSQYTVQHGVSHEFICSRNASHSMLYHVEKMLRLSSDSMNRVFGPERLTHTHTHTKPNSTRNIHNNHQSCYCRYVMSHKMQVRCTADSCVRLGKPSALRRCKAPLHTFVLKHLRSTKESQQPDRSIAPTKHTQRAGQASSELVFVHFMDQGLGDDAAV